MTVRGETNAMESMDSNELCLHTKNKFLAKTTILWTINGFGWNERGKKNSWILESKCREKSRDLWKIILTRINRIKVIWKMLRESAELFQNWFLDYFFGLFLLEKLYRFFFLIIFIFNTQWECLLLDGSIKNKQANNWMISSSSYSWHCVLLPAGLVHLFWQFSWAACLQKSVCPTACACTSP